ncbi:MAG TPA: hypothetical protein VMU18_00430 [Rhodoblastus sp.]|nr:hypothetical protein [Rhodoblastus sp.]
MIATSTVLRLSAPQRRCSLTLRYSHDVPGYNTVATNGGYLKFACAR